MSDRAIPACCGTAMRLNALEEIRDRGGDLDVGDLDVADALAWECYDCDSLHLVAWL